MEKKSELQIRIYFSRSKNIQFLTKSEKLNDKVHRIEKEKEDQ